MLHDDDLVALGVVGEEFERVVEETPLFLVEDLLGLLHLRTALLFFLPLLPLLLLLLLLLLHRRTPVQDQRLDHPPVHHVLVAVEVVVELGLPLLLLLPLRSPQIEDHLQHSFVLLADFPELVVEDDEAVFEAVDGLEVDLHAVPGDLLELLGQDLVSEDLEPAFFSYLLAFSKWGESYSRPCWATFSLDYKSMAN